MKTATFTYPVMIEAETKYPKPRKLKDVAIGCHFHLVNDLEVIYRKRAGGKCRIYRRLDSPYEGDFGLRRVGENVLVQEINPVPFVIKYYHPVWQEMLQNGN